MSGQGRPTGFKLGAFWVLLCVIVYGLVALEANQRGESGPGRPTTYSAGAGGYKALYLWLRELGIPVKRWERSPIHLSREVSVLLMMTPEIGPDSGELKALQNWIREGGTLILAMEPPQVFLKHFGFDALGKTGEEMTGSDEDPAYQPGPYTRGVLAVQSKSHRRFVSDRPETVVHLRDEWGGLVAAVREGKGSVVALADPGIFSNIDLRKGHHSRLALNLLLAHKGPGALFIDEYHHGYGRATSVMGYIGRSRIFQSLLQGGILVLILWATYGRRFGPPRPQRQREERSSMEYVKAMAQLFRRAGAQGLALSTVARWIEGEAKRLLLERDGALIEKLRGAAQGARDETLTDRELLHRVGELHGALDRAKKRASGTSSP